MEAKLNGNPDDISKLLVENSGAKAPKNPKGSARQKYNRRKIWLAHALDQMEIAINDVLSQNGQIYKLDEIETLKSAIRKFREETGLKTPEIPEPTPEELDCFLNTLSNSKPWETPIKEEITALYASTEQDDSDDNDLLNHDETNKT